MKSVFALLLLTFVSLLTGCTSLSQRLVMPGSYLKPPASIVQPGQGYELVRLQTKEGLRIVAQFGAALDPNGQRPTDTARRSTVLFFYGNRMSIAGSRDLFDFFRRAGVNVLIPDYPGYGMSDGRPSEKGCYGTADAAYSYLKSRSDIDPNQILAAGLSLGGGVAVDLASRESLAGLVLIVPFTNTRDVGLDTMPGYLRWAVPALTQHALFDNLGKISRVKCPILILRGTKDHLTSAERSQQLGAAASSKVKLVAVEADHNATWYMGRKEIEIWLKATQRFEQ